MTPELDAAPPHKAAVETGLAWFGIFLIVADSVAAIIRGVA